MYSVFFILLCSLKYLYKTTCEVTVMSLTTKTADKDPSSFFSPSPRELTNDSFCQFKLPTKFSE